jgi:hypothetical protein
VPLARENVLGDENSGIVACPGGGFCYVIT